MIRAGARLALLAGVCLQAHAGRALDAAPDDERPIDCASCAAWNAPHPPFRVFGNTYYVGVAGLSAVLIVSSDGLILLDGALPQSVPRIDASIRALGFATEHIRLIVNSHAHHDHAGGIAALQRRSGATVAASINGAIALAHGMPTAGDPQFAFGPAAMRFAPVGNVRVVGDGESLRVGDVSLTAHFTPGHTPGGTSWTWRSCERDLCLDMVYADSLNAVSHPDFRFTGDQARPGIVPAFRDSITRIATLPCDVLLAPHPDFIGMADKLARRALQPERDPFVDPDACRAYAAAASQRLERRIADELGAQR